MRRHVSALTVLATAAGPVVALAPAVARPAGADHTRVVSDCRNSAFEPATITLACRGNRVVADHIRYHQWGIHDATARVRVRTIHCTSSCRPDRATIRHARLRLDRAVRRNGERLFSRARLFHHGKLLATYDLPTGRSARPLV